MGSKQLKILYVAPFWPRREADSAGFVRGGSQNRSLSVLKALQEMGRVDVVVLEDESERGELLQEPGFELTVAHRLRVTPRGGGLVNKLRWTLDPRSNYPNGCGVAPEALHQVQGSLAGYDLVWFFKLRAPDLFPNVAWPHSVLDVDDVPSTVEQVKLRVGKGLLPRLDARRRMHSWRRREKLLGERFTVLSVCSEEDRDYLRGLGLTVPVHVIPNAFAEPAIEPVRCPAQPPRVGFIGLMEHFPNRDGIEWFAQQCWPRIKRNVPDARLRLVGMGTDGPMRPGGADVDGLGWLAEPSEEMKTWSTMVVPIRVGGGTRVKIAQGFGQKCPIVSTSFGAQGYQARDGFDMRLADSPEAFADACVDLIREPQAATELAERAWNQFLEKWTWNAIRPQVWAAAEDCLRASNP